MTTVSKPPEEVVGSNHEDPSQALPEQDSPDLIPGPSQPDTTIPLEEPQDDLPPRAVTLDDVQNYLAAAGEEEHAIIHADLTPDTREGGY